MKIATFITPAWAIIIVLCFLPRYNISSPVDEFAGMISLPYIKKSMKTSSHSIWKRKGYFWITLIFFVVSIALHWIFGWTAFVNNQHAHHQPIVFSDYAVEMARDTFENWQSEFLQLIWQVAGLAFLIYAGSPQSKDGDNRKEEKLDYIIQKLDPDNYAKLMQEWNEKFPRR